MRNPLVLYEIVAKVAEVAARVDANPLKEPTTITQAAWNAARHALADKYGAIPQAHEVCRQLADHDGAPYPWRELLELVFDPTRNIKKSHEDRLAEPQREITAARVKAALARVAWSMSRQTLLPHEYDEEREALLGRAGNARVYLARQLPTRGQIENACGGWDAALATAGLRPRGEPTTPTRRSVPVVDALVLFHAAHGYLPTQKELEDAARADGFALASDSGRSWHDWIHDAAAEIQAQSGMPPLAYGLRPEGEWQPIPVDGAELPARGTREYTRVEVVTAVREFVSTLGRASPTDVKWRAFCRGRTDVPSLGVVKRHGGLAVLVDEAARPDWQERAREHDEPRAREREERRAANRKSAAEERARTGACERVYAVIEQAGVASAQEIAADLAWPLDKVRRALAELKKAKRIYPTQAHVRSRKQTYRIPVVVSDGVASS